MALHMAIRQSLRETVKANHAFVVSVAYGIHLLVREPGNAADQYHSNRQHIASNCMAASDRKRLTAQHLFDIIRHTKQNTTTIKY